MHFQVLLCHMPKNKLKNIIVVFQTQFSVYKLGKSSAKILHKIK